MARHSGFADQLVGRWRITAEWGDRCETFADDCDELWSEVLGIRWDGFASQYNTVFSIVADGEIHLLNPTELGPYLGEITSLTEAGLLVGGFEGMPTSDGYEVFVATQTNMCPLEHLYTLWLVRADGTAEVLERITTQEIYEREDAVGKVSPGCV